MNTPFLLYVVGPPGRGKSVYIKDLLYSLFSEGKLDYGIVVCPTIFNGAYDYIPEEYRHSYYSKKVLKKLMNGQRKLISLGIEKNAFIIFDDCIGNAEFNSKIVRELVTTFRHLKINIIIASQYCKAVNPLIRECATHAAVFKLPSDLSYKAMLETFFQDYNSLENIKREFETIDKHECILVDTNKLKEDGRYKRYKAEMRNYILNF